MKTTLDDITQLARLRVIINNLENLAVQVYISPRNQNLNPSADTVDLIVNSLATAYRDIAGIGGFQTSQRSAGAPTASVPNVTDQYPPGFCPDGSTCVPCDGAGAAFPYAVSPQGVA